MKPPLLLLASLLCGCEAPFTNGLMPVPPEDAAPGEDAPAILAPEAAAGEDSPADARRPLYREGGAEATADAQAEADPPPEAAPMPEAAQPDAGAGPDVAPLPDAGHDAAPPPAVCCALSGSCSYVAMCAAASTPCHCGGAGAPCTAADLGAACWLSNGCATGTLQVCP